MTAERKAVLGFQGWQTRKVNIWEETVSFVSQSLFPKIFIWGDLSWFPSPGFIPGSKES